jgi:hypothetical protein
MRPSDCDRASARAALSTRSEQVIVGTPPVDDDNHHTAVTCRRSEALRAAPRQRLPPRTGAPAVSTDRP